METLTNAMSRTWGLLAVLALAFLLPSARAAGLQSVSPPDSRRITIAMDDYEAFRLDVSASTSVNVTVTVTAGAEIDVYVTDEGGYGQYTDPNAAGFAYFYNWSAENVTSFSRTIVGARYVLVDNAAITVNGALPEGPVTVTVEFSGPFPLLSTAVAIVVLVALAAVAGIALRARRRRREAQAGPPRNEPVQDEPPSPPVP